MLEHPYQKLLILHEPQIGILGGKDYETVKSAYGEYVLFEKMHSFSEI